ncbi:hypothetical protein Pst134EB_002291 [Puccinia striiformis f. sp. tritici]|nr:hypothetical protein Pst134EB_002291 [Puccinia striiformis f. sp. tritici]
MSLQLPRIPILSYQPIPDFNQHLQRAQAYPRRSQAASLPVHTREHSCSELNPNQKSFVESPHSITEPVSEAILAPAPDLPTPSHSLRSSIVSRLKGRASLSSRIDRSTATGSPLPVILSRVNLLLIMEVRAQLNVVVQLSTGIIVPRVHPIHPLSSAFVLPPTKLLKTE